MAALVKITVIKDTATPELKRLINLATPPRLILIRLGKRLEIVLRKYFALKGQTPNRHNWPRQHFWDRRIRNATAFAYANDREAVVNISDPAFLTHYRGATIRPREKQALAIPLQAAAYGKQPSSGLIPGLFLLRTKKGAYLVAYGDLFGRKSGASRATLHFYWKLMRSVTVPRDPNALPPDREIEAALLKEAQDYLKLRQN